jgi:hypothetical protein
MAQARNLPTPCPASVSVERLTSFSGIHPIASNQHPPPYGRVRSTKGGLAPIRRTASQQQKIGGSGPMAICPGDGMTDRRVMVRKGLLLSRRELSGRPTRRRSDQGHGAKRRAENIDTRQPVATPSLHCPDCGAPTRLVAMIAAPPRNFDQITSRCEVCSIDMNHWTPELMA